jgi:hypothetical protein
MMLHPKIFCQEAAVKPASLPAEGGIFTAQGAGRKEHGKGPRLHEPGLLLSLGPCAVSL